MRLIRNQVYPQGYRGFESLSLRFVSNRVCSTRRDDRVAEGARLEIVCVERHRGFESRSLRQYSIPLDAPPAPLRGIPSGSDWEQLWLRATER